MKTTLVCQISSFLRTWVWHPEIRIQSYHKLKLGSWNMKKLQEPKISKSCTKTRSSSVRLNRLSQKSSRTNSLRTTLLEKKQRSSSILDWTQLCSRSWRRMARLQTCSTKTGESRTKNYSATWKTIGMRTPRIKNSATRKCWLNRTCVIHDGRMTKVSMRNSRAVKLRLGNSDSGSKTMTRTKNLKMKWVRESPCISKPYECSRFWW